MVIFFPRGGECILYFIAVLWSFCYSGSQVTDVLANAFTWQILWALGRKLCQGSINWVFWAVQAHWSMCRKATGYAACTSKAAPLCVELTSKPRDSLFVFQTDNNSIPLILQSSWNLCGAERRLRLNIFTLRDIIGLIIKRRWWGIKFKRNSNKDTEPGRAC